MVTVTFDILGWKKQIEIASWHIEAGVYKLWVEKPMPFLNWHLKGEAVCAEEHGAILVFIWNEELNRFDWENNS